MGMNKFVNTLMNKAASTLFTDKSKIKLVYDVNIAHN